MPVNQPRLLRKLQAIRDKDVDGIVAKKVYLPFIGNNYTKQQLVNWFQSRIDLLEQAVNATDQQIENRVTTYYNSLNAADKAIADKIIADQDYDLGLASNFNAYEKLVAIILSKFILD
jgi:hypothetical protein